jgi:hypothetical protein
LVRLEEDVKAFARPTQYPGEEEKDPVEQV